MSDYRSGFADLIEQFVCYRKMSGSWNETNYGYYLQRFDNFCADNYPGSPLQQDMIDKWCIKRETELNRSRNTRIRVLGTFIAYLQKRGLTDITPPTLLANEPCSYIPHAFTIQELQRFFYECDHIQPKRNCIDSVLPKYICPVLFRLLYSSGIRTTEARLLRRNNVDLEYGVLDIQETKGYDQHYVALHSSMTELLKKYDEFINNIQPNREYFFQSAKGKYFEHNWLEVWFRKLWKKANGNDIVATAYELRHHYATTNINSWDIDNFGFSDKLLYLSKSMGHRGTGSTLHYYSIVPRLAETIKKSTENGFNDIITEVTYEEE